MVFWTAVRVPKRVCLTISNWWSGRESVAEGTVGTPVPWVLSWNMVVVFDVDNAPLGTADGRAPGGYGPKLKP